MRKLSCSDLTNFMTQLKSVASPSTMDIYCFLTRRNEHYLDNLIYYGAAFLKVAVGDGTRGDIKNGPAEDKMSFSSRVTGTSHAVK